MTFGRWLGAQARGARGWECRGQHRSGAVRPARGVGGGARRRRPARGTGSDGRGDSGWFMAREAATAACRHLARVGISK
jgi:hypothetical protein